jgi:ferredoxin
MTHKLASWIDQFGSSGCVGCGRCITWCPVAIDITEEAAAIRATDLRDLATPNGGPDADD